MSFNRDKDKQDPAVTKQIANYLFEKPLEGETGEFLDIRTDVNTKGMFNALVYYRVLGEYFKCKAATRVANILERLSISSNREGRHEGVIGLLQKLGSPKYLSGGMDELMAALKEKVDGDQG